MKAKRAIVLAILLVLPLLPGCYKSSDFKRIGILNWSEGLVGYRQAHKGIIDGLHASGYREGFNIEIDYRTAAGKDAEAKNILDDFAHRRYDLVVTIGSAACLAAVEALKGTRVPLVFAVVGNPKESEIIDDWSSPGREITGVAIDIAPEIYFEKLRMILPRAKDVGLVYVNRYATARAAAQQAKDVGIRVGLIPHMIEFSEGDLDGAEEIIAKIPDKLDAVFFTADPTLYADAMMKRLIPAFKARGVPSMLISENYLKYGALFAVSPDYYRIGRQTAPHILKVLDGVPASEVPSETPYDMVFVLNKASADGFGAPLSWNALIDADRIVE